MQSMLVLTEGLQRQTAPNCHNIYIIPESTGEDGE